MGLRYRVRLRTVALAMAVTALLGSAACGEGNGEGGEEGGQIQEEGGEQEED